MSVEYDGYNASTGFLTKLTNPIDRKQYTVSTVPKKNRFNNRFNNTCWETAVLKSGFFGSFRPLFFMPDVARDEDTARKIHNSVKSSLGNIRLQNGHAVL